VDASVNSAMAADPVTVMTLPEVDVALDGLATDGDRIAGALVALESHPGRRFLEGSRLTGRTAELWEPARADIALLYARFDSYRAVLAQAREVRARRSRPGATELAELSALLRARAVVLSTEEIPLERRDLTGPDTVTQRMSLRELVASMDAAFKKATEVVVAADEVWTAFVARLDPLDAHLDSARELAASLGLGESGDPLCTELGAIADDLADTRALAFADPLALYAGALGSGQPDLSRVHDLDGRITSVGTALAPLAAVRAELDELLHRATAAIDGVADAETQARAAYDRVLDKIAAPAIAEVPAESAALRVRLACVRDLVDGQRWPRVSAELTALGAATGAALERVQEVRDTAAALLGRREELRGRLAAYRVKAARLHLNEDAEIADDYQQAHDLLWTSPCDLRAATRSLVRYQRAIAAKESAR
jgi:hypothetical protein